MSDVKSPTVNRGRFRGHTMPKGKQLEPDSKWLKMDRVIFDVNPVPQMGIKAWLRANRIVEHLLGEGRIDENTVEEMLHDRTRAGEIYAAFGRAESVVVHIGPNAPEPDQTVLHIKFCSREKGMGEMYRLTYELDFHGEFVRFTQKLVQPTPSVRHARVSLLT
jgi:hypothetical protein